MHCQETLWISTALNFSVNIDLVLFTLYFDNSLQTFRLVYTATAKECFFSFTKMAYVYPEIEYGRFFKTLVHNGKTGSMRKYFFYSLDKANLKCTL